MNISDIIKPRMKDWESEEGLLLLSCWVRDGIKLGDVAKMMGITQKTLCDWRNKSEKIDNALKVSKEIVDYKVENALFRAAVGFKSVETKTIISGEQDEEGNRVVRVERTEKDIAPNVTACLAWLNNRKPKEWRRNRDNEVEVNDDNNNITINIIKHNSDDKVETESAKTEDEEWDELEEE